jgi:hypothetical protein
MAVVLPTPSSPEVNDEKNLVLQDVVEVNALANIHAETEDLLVVSPYTEEPHLLSLKTVDTANQLLAKALVGLKCLRDDYATAPYVEIFNVSKYAPRW